MCDFRNLFDPFHGYVTVNHTNMKFLSALGLNLEREELAKRHSPILNGDLQH